MICLPFVLLMLSLSGCTEQTVESKPSIHRIQSPIPPYYQGTIAMLETRVTNQQGTITARGRKINAQRTQIATLRPTPVPTPTYVCPWSNYSTCR